MKVCFQSRTTLFSVPGGDTIQILKTAEALRNLGCHVDVSTELEPDVSGYDMVHVFNLMRPQETYMQALNAKRQERKIALSPIYVDYREYDTKARGAIGKCVARAFSSDLTEYIKIGARVFLNREFNRGTAALFRHGFRKLQRRVLGMADVLLPNSESEAKRVRKDFPEASQKSYIIVPNGIDAGLFDPTKVPAIPEMETYRGCVICVARIEGRKNQLQLVYAMKELPWQLLLIGKPAPNHIRYYNKIRRMAGPNVHILGEVSHELLPQYYLAARVHVLASWMETTGLSSLEAGAMGCNLVVTDKGDTRDYFGDYAFYCEPESVDSIRDAIARAYEAPVNPALREHVLRNYTWEKAAEATYKAYQEILP